MTAPYDTAIVGGGIVGLATTLALVEKFPNRRFVIIEKEAKVAAHQTGNNSGVIHAGIYYRPGSEKARLCVEGVRLMKEFCRDNGIPVEECGKVIVAISEEETVRLDELQRRGEANGVPGLKMIGPEELDEIEPGVVALGALVSPGTAIVDYSCVAQVMAQRLRESGVEILCDAELRGIHSEAEGLRLETRRPEVSARNLINCAGLYSDRVARMMGLDPGLRIIPFRGEYYLLRAEQKVVRGLIYPVPDPEFPFLGVHFTKRIGGEMEAGPNAVLALAREGYSIRNVRLGESAEIFRYTGFWRMAGKYWKTGLYEVGRSLSKRAFLRALQRLAPAIESRDLLPGGAGVRAQAVTPDGALVDDFHIVSSSKAVHILNAPSPGATASLAIGKHIATLAGKNFNL